MISIIIPCYNSETFVGRALDSVLKQTYKDWEIILVNNNSTDGTQAVLDAFQAKYPEKVRVFNETKKGAPAARNKGLQEAKGEWVQFLDADDEILPEKLAGQIALAEKEGASIVTSPYTRIGTRDRKHFVVPRGLYLDDVWSALILSNMGITSSNLFKRALLLQVEGWDEKLVASQEYDMMFRMLQLNPKVAFDNRDLTIIHFGSVESVSRTEDRVKGRKILDSRIDLRFRIKKYLAENNLLTEERSAHVSKFIFETLMLNYRTTPEDVTEILGKLKLDISIWKRLHGWYFMRKMDLKKLLIKYKLMR
ncbi:glycosyltransferase family 2 protein [Pedobacter sp. SAFR-022]|uniref:glycosyltransferase family 2 protein n=1 Tax=Pedobacter sp. SAFR-022 TaxID=3436861 RepID=UPI003F8172E2